MDCPICLGEGEDLTPVAYKGLVMNCQRCGGFRITNNALVVLRNLKVEGRLEALFRAGTFASRAWPTISNACF